MMKYFPLGGNEIKYVEKPRKLHHFSPFCGNKLILQLPVLYSFYFLEVIGLLIITYSGF